MEADKALVILRALGAYEWPSAEPDDYESAVDTVEDTIERLRSENAELQRELADTVDMLQQCADRNDKIESLNERVERELSETKRALLIPGVMSCAKCNFRLYRQNLYMPSGAVGSGGNETEPCPNGCGPLWPVTWKREASENLTLAEAAHAERMKAERERDAALAAIREAPHSPSCAAMPIYDEYENALFPNSPVRPGDEAKCNCWKRAAVGGEG